MKKIFLFITLLTTSLINSNPTEALEKKVLTLADKISQANTYCKQLNALQKRIISQTAPINLSPIEPLDTTIIKGLPEVFVLAFVEQVTKDLDEYNASLKTVHEYIKLVLAE